MIRPALLAAALSLSACVSTSPVGADGTTLYGAASCRASARGACPELSGRTFYERRNADLFYFAPDGTVYETRGTNVRTSRWGVSADGTRLTGSGGFGALGIPIAAMVSVHETYRGDPAGLADGSVAARLSGTDTRPFSAIAAELRGS